MNTRTDHRRTRSVLVGLALAGSAVVGGTGIAAAASDTADDPDVTQLLQTDDDSDETASDVVDPQERRESRVERRESRRADRAEVAELLGLTTEELGERVRDGATLAEVAAEQGVDVSSLVDLITSQVDDRLDAAVENGRLTQAEADDRAADVEERVQTRVDEGRPERGDHGGRRGGGSRGEVVPTGDEAPADGES